MSVILHTTDCPKCKILEQKLKEKNIEYEVNHNIDVKAMRDKGLMGAPILQVGDIYMGFVTANEWVKNQ